MRLRKRAIGFKTSVLLFLVMPAIAAELPAGFPDDVPIADFMEVVGVTQVRDDMMVDLHAPGQTLEGVVDWMKAGLSAAGWKSDGESVTERQAILAYSKNGRKCGVTVTNFVLNSSMQMDDSIKGISLQVSGAAAPVDEQSDSASEAVDGAQR